MVALPALQVARLWRRLAAVVDARREVGERVADTLAAWLQEAAASKDTVLAAVGQEAVLTVAALAGCRGLVPAALRQVSALLQSRHTSHVYTGLQGLQALFARHPPVLATEQEAAVLACLAHPEPAIQRRTLGLVLVLATRDNVAAVVDKIVAHVKAQGEEEGGEVVEEAAALVLRLGATLDWRASSLLRLVQVARGEARRRTVERLKFLLADPAAGEQEAADELELNRVRGKLRGLLAGLVERGAPPAVVAALWAWCEGRWPAEGALTRLEALGRASGEVEVVVATLRAAQAILVRGGEEGAEGCLAWVAGCREEGQEEVRVVAADVLQLVRLVRREGSPEVEEAQEEQVVVRDPSLSFLDGLVVEGLARGLQPYTPQQPQPSACPALRPYSPCTTTSPTSPPSLALSQASQDSGPTHPLWTLQGRGVEEQGGVEEVGRGVEELGGGVEVVGGEGGAEVEGGSMVDSLEAVLADGWS